MILTLALRSLLAHPIRSLVLACGFGLGISVMATLLGVGEVILQQARAPALAGGGNVLIGGPGGQVPNARWILSSGLRASAFDGLVTVASPTARATLFLVRNGKTTSLRTRGGIPSLERAMADPETSAIASWVDAPADADWISPDPATSLRALDRFHPIPDAPLRADSWAEWLYFNGRMGGSRFYLTFLVGPRRGSGKRAAGVRLQLDREGRRSSYSASQEIDEADLLANAPDLSIGSSRVRLDGLRYQLTVDLPAETGGTGRARGSLTIESSPGRELPPLTIQGAGGWVSGYVVPVMSGALSGTVVTEGGDVPFDGGTGYHDHNWGFWKGVSWQWGQVHQGELSFVYGRIRPPADAADPDRVPGVLAVLGPNGPLGYSRNVTIEEKNDAATGRPQAIFVRGRGSSLDLTLELDIEDTVVTQAGRGPFGGGLDFLQLNARYRVRGRAADRSVDFTADGTAETFRTKE